MEKRIITVFFGTVAQETKETANNYCVFWNMCLGDQGKSLELLCCLEHLLRRPWKKLIITVLFGTFAQETKEKAYNYSVVWNMCLGNQ